MRCEVIIFIWGCQFAEVLEPPREEVILVDVVSNIQLPCCSHVFHPLVFDDGKH